MRYFRKFGRGKYQRKRGVRRARRGNKKPSKFLKRTIQSIVSKNIEDKLAYRTTGDSLVYFNSGINSSGDVLQVLPDIGNGTGENNRIGDQIRAKYMVIRGYLQMAINTSYNDIATKRLGVRLLVVASKKVMPYPDLASQAGSALLEKGGVVSTFAGNISDLYAPINKEAYTVYYDKIHYLSQSYIREQIGSSTPTQLVSVDVSKGIKFFTIKIPLRGKKLLYDSGTSTVVPTNWSCGLMCGYAHLDGSSPDTVSTQVGVCYDVDFRFEDA